MAHLAEVSLAGIPILVTRDGRVKIADLGMVKTFDDDLSLTQTGHAVGTPWYMPLEQAKNSKDTDKRCDIYALGCTLYCLLTGSPPYRNAETLATIAEAKDLEGKLSKYVEMLHTQPTPSEHRRVSGVDRDRRTRSS